MISNAIEVILFVSMTTIYVIADGIYLLRPALSKGRFPLVRNRSAER
jgi:hypothetical protein